MTQQEIIEKKIALAQNDINHYNKNMSDIEGQVDQLNKAKRVFAQKISKKQIYIGLLQKDIEQLYQTP